MKTCLLIDVSFSPPHSKILSEMRILRRNGFEVTLISVEDKDLPEEETIEGMRHLRARRSGIYSSPFKSVLSPLTLLSVLLKALREKADIYHCHGFTMSTVIVPILKLLRKRVIYAVYDDHPSIYSYYIKQYFHLGFVAGLAEKILRLVESILCRYADYVVTLREPLTRDRRVYTKRVKTISYGVDPLFNPANTDSSLIERFKGFSAIVYSGTIGAESGLNEILEAFKIIRQQTPDALLLMVGSSKSSRQDESLREEPNVVVTGWLPFWEMPKYICLGKVGLVIINPAHRSQIYNLPFKLYEDMACGLPIVAFKGFPEIERMVHSANAGLLVYPDSPQQIAEAVIKLLQDEELRTTMGRNAYNYIQQHNTLEKMEGELMEVYRSVLRS